MGEGFLDHQSVRPVANGSGTSQVQDRPLGDLTMRRCSRTIIPAGTYWCTPCGNMMRGLGERFLLAVAGQTHEVYGLRTIRCETSLRLHSISFFIC